jgi:hypothetical protein
MALFNKKKNGDFINALEIDVSVNLSTYKNLKKRLERR